MGQLSTQVTSQEKKFPDFYGITVDPLGRLSSSRSKRNGSKFEAIFVEASVP